MRKARPLPPADINPWGKTIEQDVDKNLGDIERLSVNVGAALQAAGNAVTAVKGLAASSEITASSWSVDVTVGSGWSASPLLPAVSAASPTGRMEINFGGAIRNGSGRICFSITNSQGVVIAPRDVMRVDFARCIALTGGASFPASGHRIEIFDVGTDMVTIKIEVYGEAAGVVLSGSTLAVRPAP